MEYLYRFSKIIVWCVIVCWSCTGRGPELSVSIAKQETKIQPVDKRKQLVDTAIHYLYVREATGRNDGPLIEQWQKTVGLHKGDGWCTAWAVSMHIYCDIPIPKTGYSPALFEQNVVHRKSDWRKFTAKPGQVAGFSAGKRIDHSAIIEKQMGNNVYFLEGNYSNGVRRVVRNFDLIYVISDYIKPLEK